MKNFKVIASLLGGVIVILGAGLLFIFGSNNANQSNKVNYQSASSAQTSQHHKQQASSSQSSSSSKPRSTQLSYEELAIAAYIDSLRGNSIDDKFKTFNEVANGQSANPATEQPMAIKQHEDPTFEIG